MSRSFPIWLFAVVICSFIGCGGGDATDSPLVAEADNSSASSEAAMGMSVPSGDGGSESMDPSMEMSSSSGMPGEVDSSTYGAGGAGTGAAPGMDPADYAGTEYAGAEYAGTEADAADGAMSPEDYAAMAENAGADYDGAAMAETADPASGENYPGAAGTEGEYAAGEYPGGEGGPGGVAEKLPEGFEGKAQYAFRKGKDRDAIQYLYAYALTTDAGAESVLPTIRWVAGLREPKLAVRWGVGFVVTAPRNFNGDPKPVGSKQNIPTRGGNRAGGGDGGYVGGGGEGDYGGGGDGGAKNSLLSKGAGELGEKLAAAYTERLMRGDFGEVLKKAMEGGRGDTRSGGEYGGAGGMGYEGGGAEMSPGPGGSAGGPTALTEVSHIMTGLSMLGIGTQKELIDRAREEDIDAVVIIDVKLRVNTSNGLVTNESTLALLDTKTQKKLHTTKKFNNITIQTARDEGKDDGVDEELESLFEAIDANFKMTDLPAALNAEVAAKRVAALVAEKRDNPLPILAEARMYNIKGMLEESILFSTYEQVMGVDFGRKLATGEEDDKKSALSRWLPES